MHLVAEAGRRPAPCGQRAGGAALSLRCIRDVPAESGRLPYFRRQGSAGAQPDQGDCESVGHGQTVAFLVGQAAIMPLVFPVVRILQKLWGRPPIPLRQSWIMLETKARPPVESAK